MFDSRNLKLPGVAKGNGKGGLKGESGHGNLNRKPAGKSESKAKAASKKAAVKKKAKA